MLDSRLATKAIAALSMFVAIAALSGCGGLNLDPRDNQTRTVTAPADSARTLTFKEGMVWCYDQQARHCLRLPEGVYTIEAEDRDFYYFRAPTPLDFRFLDKPEGDKRRLIPGGVALCKSFNPMLVAEVYIDGEGGQKTLIFKLGGDFARMEPSTWTRNF